jgi:hypothetical protein
MSREAGKPLIPNQGKIGAVFEAVVFRVRILSLTWTASSAAMSANGESGMSDIEGKTVSKRRTSAGSEWGNSASPITADQIAVLRKELANHPNSFRRA